MDFQSIRARAIMYVPRMDLSRACPKPLHLTVDVKHTPSLGPFSRTLMYYFVNDRSEGTHLLLYLL